MTRGRIVRVLVLLALVGVAVLVLANSRDELVSAAQGLGRVNGSWVAVAGLLELVSYTAYAGTQRLLLRRAGGPALGLGVLTTTALVAQAAANCLPGGVAVTGLVSYRQFTRRGVGAVLTGWVLLLTSGLFLAALGLLSLVAVQVAGADDPVPALRTVSIALVLGLVLLGTVAAVLRSRWDLRGVEVRVRRALRRVVGRVRPGTVVPLEPRLSLQLTTFRIGVAGVVGGLLTMLLCWTADVAVLVAAYRALGTPPPWRGLLLAYCAGQVAASLPFTPGGLGVVEGSLTLALVAFGGAQATTLTAVLLYRLVSYWSLLPVGAAGWLVLRRAAGRAVVEAPEPLPAREPAS